MAKTRSEKYKEYQSRFNRWHDKQIEFTSVTINLIFTISIGLAGFLIGQKDNSLHNSTVFCCFNLFKISLILLGISISIGVVLLCVRILSFKLTKDILKARKLEEDGAGTHQKIDEARLKSAWCDKLIHPLMGLQIFFFLVSIWTLIVSA